jgi:hypothetical protein
MGNLTSSFAWNATFTQLTVTVPATSVSSLYSVDLCGGTSDKAYLTDMNDNVLTNACNTAGTTLVNFTTNGAAAAAAPVVTINNSTSLDYIGSPVLDWLPVSGAVGYHVYRATIEAGVTTPYTMFGEDSVGPCARSVSLSTYIDATDCGDGAGPVPAFTDGQNKVTYSYTVRSVNADGSESADSNTVTAEDAVKPTFSVATNATGGPGGVGLITLTFSEPVDEASAETVANYALTRSVVPAAPTVASAVASVSSVVLTMSTALTVDTNNTLTVTNVTDIAGNVNDTTGGINAPTF